MDARSATTVAFSKWWRMAGIWRVRHGTISVFSSLGLGISSFRRSGARVVSNGPVTRMSVRGIETKESDGAIISGMCSGSKGFKGGIAQHDRWNCSCLVFCLAVTYQAAGRVPDEFDGRRLSNAPTRSSGNVERGRLRFAHFQPFLCYYLALPACLCLRESLTLHLSSTAQLIRHCLQKARFRGMCKPRKNKTEYGAWFQFLCLRVSIAEKNGWLQAFRS